MHTSFLHIMLLLAVALLNGCAGTVCMESKRHLQQFDGGTRAVYVTNPELQREYEILRASSIYHLSNQPTGTHKLRLHPIQQYGRCGNPLMLSALTLGIVPGFLPGAYVFEYDLEADGVAERYVHQLPLYERFSIWEWLVRRDEQKVFAEALAWSARERLRSTRALQRRHAPPLDAAIRFGRAFHAQLGSPAAVAEIGHELSH